MTAPGPVAPPVDLPTVVELAHRMHVAACPRWRDEPTDEHAALYLAAAEVVVAAGWRPVSRADGR